MLLLILSACILPVYGQSTEKESPSYSETVYFRLGKADVDSTYANNRKGLHVLNTLFSDTVRVSLIDSIHIYAYASPEGRKSYNDKLAQRRSVAMKQYLTSNHPFLEHMHIRLLPQGENWEGMKKLVEENKGFDKWEEVLMILNLVKESDRRKEYIKRLNGGKTYEYIKDSILPQLRNAGVCTIWVNDRLRDSSNLPSKLSIPLSRGVGVCSYAPTDIIRPDALTHPLPPPGRRVKYSALKTNLAAWAAGCVNLAYETQIGKHFSIDIPLMWSSWDISKKHALRIIAIQPELRYWLTTPGKGHFFGVHAQAARYNLKWNNNRYQDTNRPLLGGGIGYGYSLPFNETWGMEFNIGAGYMNTKYNVYYNTPNVKDGQLYDTRILNHWGITRVGISFIYKLTQP